MLEWRWYLSFSDLLEREVVEPTWCRTNPETGDLPFQFKTSLSQVDRGASVIRVVKAWRRRMTRTPWICLRKTQIQQKYEWLVHVFVSSHRGRTPTLWWVLLKSLLQQGRSTPPTAPWPPGSRSYRTSPRESRPPQWRLAAASSETPERGERERENHSS